MTLQPVFYFRMSPELEQKVIRSTLSGRLRSIYFSFKSAELFILVFERWIIVWCKRQPPLGAWAALEGRQGSSEGGCKMYGIKHG